MRTTLIAAMAVLIASSYLSVSGEAQNLSKDKLERQDEIERLELELAGRDRELSRLSRHISELSELLSLEQEAAVQLRELIVELRELVVTPAEAGKNFLRGLLADDVKASETIGLSPSITCGKKVVTIPLIIEGKHMMSLTVWKSDIVRIGYVPPGAIEGSRSGAQAITDSIHIHTKEMPRDDLGLVTPKRNYAPLLECLDQD